MADPGWYRLGSLPSPDIQNGADQRCGLSFKGGKDGAEKH